MYKIDSEKNIEVTRGDYLPLSISAKNDDGTNYIFKVGDVVRMNVVKRNNYSDIIKQKDVSVSEETTSVVFELESSFTKIGTIINRPVQYFYEVVLNPDTKPQTIVGYESETKHKLFTLLPEAGDYVGDSDDYTETPGSNGSGLLEKIINITGVLEKLNTKDKSNLVNAINEVVSNGGGTTNYNLLQNKPSINNVKLEGNKSLEELGIQPRGNYVDINNVTAITGLLENLNTEDKETLVNAINEVNGKTVKVLTGTPELNNLDAGYYILKGVNRISNGGITGISFVDGGTSDKVLVVGEFTKDNIVHKIGYIFGSKSHIGIINTYDGTSVINFNNILYMDNTEEYIPTEDYNPATKKYVDDAVAENSGGDTSFYTYNNVGELFSLSSVTSMGTDALNKLINDVLSGKTTYLTIKASEGCYLFKMEKQYNGRIRGYNTYFSNSNALYRIEIYIDYNKTTYAFTTSTTSRTVVKEYVNKQSITKTVTSNTLVLNHNQDARLGELTTLILSMPTSYSDFYESEFSFLSGATATTLTYSSTPLIFVGDDVDSDGSFIPEPNTLYEVSVKNLGTNGIIARVGSV